MDPELLLLAPAAAVLAVLGARRQASQQNGPTAGQRVEVAGGDIARQVGGVLGAVAERPAALSGGLLRTTGVLGAELADRTIRTAGRVGGGAVSTVVGAAGRVTARGTGLLVDGGSTVVDAAASIPARLRGEHGPAPAAAARTKSAASPARRSRKRQG